MREEKLQEFWSEYGMLSLNPIIFPIINRQNYQQSEPMGALVSTRSEGIYQPKPMR